MKRMLTNLLVIYFLSLPVQLFATAYEASTLHNSVMRSESVQELFFERWALIQENNWNFDFFGKINWVPGFKIYAEDRETGKKEAVDMRLIRTYGGFTCMYQFGNPGTENREKGSDYMVGFTTTGYHYGLTRQTNIDRGSAGSDSVSDYKYSQFFDDIFAVSLVWKPYVYLHGGILVNNEIEPNDDGTMSYFSSSNITTRWFVASNLLSFLSTNFVLKENEIESMEAEIALKKLYGYIRQLPPLVPEVTVGLKSVGLYRDETYDAVWVKTVKSDTDPKQKAKLYTLSLLIEENIYDTLYLSCYACFQKPSEKLIEKRTGDELNFRPLKTFSCSAGFDHLYKKANMKLISTLGYSQLWDEAMPVHADTEKYLAHGFFYSLSYKIAGPGHDLGTKIYVGYNNAEELDRLIETVDKVSLQWEFNISFNTWSFKKNEKKKK